ncbi:MAG: cytochrome C oxidase subunit IV family protein [Methylobacterium sp.]|uniref:cytochrome C oxidase subunit IV family protein n=1 Tax=Methylobacterium sp. TaxID=409 RepID=UPI00258B3CD1|nr:cytochrome C oxidase subunit IV family protein [Methylobacterium sp.]MBY0294708.1 cytochrome C oxidase subunit IV family protein [Methylobacterium sp.]
MSPALGRIWLRSLAVWAALLALLALTYFAAFWKLGVGTTAIGFAIAAIKAALVLAFFMELRKACGLVRLAAAAGLIWTSVLFALTLSDVLSRS